MFKSILLDQITEAEKLNDDEFRSKFFGDKETILNSWLWVLKAELDQYFDDLSGNVEQTRSTTTPEDEEKRKLKRERARLKRLERKQKEEPQQKKSRKTKTETPDETPTIEIEE